MTIRVLLADDEPLVRAGLAMLLDSEPDLTVVGEAGDGTAAVSLARDLQPDVVLMDVRMPAGGVEAARQLAQEPPRPETDHVIKVIMLTTFNDDDAVYAALRAGASGFLLKDAAPENLVSAIRTVASGDAWLHPPVARKLLADFASRPERNVPPPATMQQLTDREREVLVLIAHGFSNSEIAAHLYVGEATVKTHVSRIFIKLGLRDRAQAAVAAYQSGLVKPGSSPPAQSE